MTILVCDLRSKRKLRTETDPYLRQRSHQSSQPRTGQRMRRRSEGSLRGPAGQPKRGFEASHQEILQKSET